MLDLKRRVELSLASYQSALLGSKLGSLLNSCRVNYYMYCCTLLHEHEDANGERLRHKKQEI